MCGGKWFATVYSVRSDGAIGLAVIAIVFGGGALYSSGGIALGAANGRAGGRIRVAAHPHYAHWVSFAGLVADGLHFTLGRAPLGARRGYTNVRSGARINNRKSKSRKKHASKRLDALSEIADELTKAGMNAASAACASTDGSTGRATSTPRSELSIGARETGVKVQM